MIAAAFDEAERRDPGHLRPWVALVDGAKHQIDVINAEARRRNIAVTIVVDWIHVVEYIWAAARFFPETDPAGEAFVAEKALAVLEGKAGLVAGAIRRKATMCHLEPKARERADECARYLKNKKAYLDYPKALAAGWPIATGVIEGACAHLVRDRRDRGTLVRQRCGGDPQATSRAFERRLARVLRLPPGTRAQARSRLSLRRWGHPGGCLNGPSSGATPASDRSTRTSRAYWATMTPRRFEGTRRRCLPSSRSIRFPTYTHYVRSSPAASHRTRALGDSRGWRRSPLTKIRKMVKMEQWGR